MYVMNNEQPKTGVVRMYTLPLRWGVLGTHCTDLNLQVWDT